MTRLLMNLLRILSRYEMRDEPGACSSSIAQSFPNMPDMNPDMPFSSLSSRTAETAISRISGR